jgi:hypothetical protein
VLVSTQTAFWKMIQEFGEEEMTEIKDGEEAAGSRSSDAVMAKVVKARIRERVMDEVSRELGGLSRLMDGTLTPEELKEMSLQLVRFTNEGTNDACAKLYSDIVANGFNPDKFRHGH